MSADRSNQAALEEEDIHAGYNGREVQRGVSVSIPAGQCVHLIGPNGCGKSTLFGVVAGRLRTTEGRVKFAGKPLERFSTDVRIQMVLVYLNGKES